jgi:hypothetical protein
LDRLDRLAGWKGGETGELVEGTIGAPGEETPAPATSMAAVFELGATQNELQHLRREVAECQNHLQALSGVVEGLGLTVAALSSRLEAVTAEEERIEEVMETEARASFLERILGGHHTPINRGP